NRERRSFLLPPDDRIALVAGTDEITVVDPLLLQKFDRGHRLGAHEQEDGAVRYFIVCLRQRVWIVWWSKGCPAPDETMDVDVGQPGQIRIPRVHAPDMRSEWHLPPMRVIRIVKVVVSLRVGTERGIVLVRRQRQRRAAAPAADQLRGDQLTFF